MDPSIREFISVSVFDASMRLFSDIYSCLRRRVRAKNGEDAVDDGTEESSNLFFHLQNLQIATNFFSEMNRLGHGGFGPVYKGLMPNGQEVAVKKLSLNSTQGLKEFTNEMLVYEYLPNKSLDYFLFDKKKSQLLDWKKRYKIINGIARGLLYLHEGAPERIIHRDIKASNILLDEQLNPKISDFGIARLFPGDDTHLNTLKISGTLGYMAPEYAIRGYLSVKTDVFSFGILVLEIVSGRKNRDGLLDAEKADLLNYTWTLFKAGKLEELFIGSLDKYNPDEAAMCIQLGLLCCQASIADRPDMNSVHLMLSSDSFTLPRPGKPGIYGCVSRYTTTTSAPCTNTTNGSTNQTGITKASIGSSFVEDYSRNSISHSSMEEGR
ncbi:unnamed protein product [Fraxinus pennsylvanica]|uniref:Protein kinase domain-containing protein n=1 Tax=Fraxinus pennsylvanica TaxID=56036 RepID=A0AAD2DHX2_9LAMI|nr:unnamed protein product [Fraxinus pennsylvanica]